MAEGLGTWGINFSLCESSNSSGEGVEALGSHPHCPTNCTTGLETSGVPAP